MTTEIRYFVENNKYKTDRLANKFTNTLGGEFDVLHINDRKFYAFRVTMGCSYIFWNYR